MIPPKVPCESKDTEAYERQGIQRLFFKMMTEFEQNTNEQLNEIAKPPVQAKLELENRKVTYISTINKVNWKAQSQRLKTE